jgi:DNA modification methylase
MIRSLQGDCRDIFKTLPDESVHCVVTSPPYWGLRDYGHGEQIGLEPTPEAYVATMVEVFREVRRVLRKDGTLWLNLGDSFKDKNLIGMPWRVAFALQTDGWYLRQDIIWAKPNPMPESVTDRCTKAHEYIFLLSKSPRYYYDQDAIREEIKAGSGIRMRASKHDGCRGDKIKNPTADITLKHYQEIKGANRRSVWEIDTQPFREAHFATFPPALIEPCVMAGCPKGGTVLDPFGGAGTTGMVADRLQRDAIIIELNPDYAAMAELRLQDDAGMFAQIEMML